MIINFRRNPIISSPVLINNQAVEQVPQQKSVCAVIDDMLTFEPQVDAMCKKEGCTFIGNLFFLTRTAVLCGCFIHVLVESILTFSLICWYGLAGDRLQSVGEGCSKIAGIKPE